MRDEEEVLGDGTLRATTDIEGDFEFRDDDTGLMATNGDALEGVIVNDERGSRFRVRREHGDHAQAEAVGDEGGGCSPIVGREDAGWP